MRNEPEGYPVGLAGESNYQAAICVCLEGEPVRVCHEVGNPYDEDALVVISQRNEVIGYIPRSNWLRDAIHDQGRGCYARILSIEGERERMGVVLDVQLTDEELDVRDYEPTRPASKATSGTGCLVVAGGIPLALIVATAM